MAQKNLKVEPQKLTASAKAIDEKILLYNKQVEAIYSAISELSGTWKGQSFDAFNKQLEGYRNDFNKLAEVLGKYSDALVKAAGRYNETDSKLAGDAQRLSSGR